MRTEQELQQADLGDARLNARLRLIVDAFTDKPNASIPHACPTTFDQTYDFFANPRVTADALRQAHYHDTIARCKGQGEPLLLPSDTTWLDFSTHKKVQGLGYQQHKNQHGLFLHTTLACTPAGVPLGVLDQQAWIRDPKDFGKRKQRRKKATKDKESQRWLDAFAACGQRLPEGQRAVFITDREGDVFDLFATPRPVGVDLLVRADTRRCLEGEERLLGEVMAHAPVWATDTVEVPRKDGVPGRQAHVEIRVQAVRLAVPSTHPKRSKQTPIPVTALLVTEPTPPAGEEALSWVLLTTLTVPDAATALVVVGYYRVRWRVERYHFTLKSGCQVEQLQLETREGLERAAAVYSIVAVRLLRLTYLARVDPQTSCASALTSLEWRVLLAQMRSRFKVVWQGNGPPTLGEAVLWLARLGGYVGRGKHAVPGVKVLWRGLQCLTDLVAGYQLAQNNMHDPPAITQISTE